MIIRLGSCQRCGKCCDPATLPARMQAYRRHHSVVVIVQHPNGCRHFRHEDGKGVCAIYGRRPQMCRLFPLFPADTEALPTCSYRFVEVPQ